MMNQKTKKIVKITVDVFLWIFLALSVFTTVLAFSAQSSSGRYPKLGDKCLLTVSSSSMDAPGGFKKGDLLVCRVLTDADRQALKPGDVISFYADLKGDGTDEEQMNTHRIVAISDQGVVTTKGDAYTTNDVLENDQKLMLSDAEAIWEGTRIVALGGAIAFLRSAPGFFLCIALPLFAFFVYELVVLIRMIQQIRNKDKRQITKEEEELIKQRAVEEFLARYRAEQNAASAEGTAEGIAEGTAEGTAEASAEGTAEGDPA